MTEPTRYIGMDVHKETIVIAIAVEHDRGKATLYGTIQNTRNALNLCVEKLHRANPGPLRFCYEAGPCGYGIHRALTAMGQDCVVIAPSLTPRRPGERHKTDTRDAADLATLLRAGLLTPIWVPDAAHEAMRDLVRARQASVRAVRTARQQLSAFLLRHDRRYTTGRQAWTLAHRRWLSELTFEQPAQHIVLEEAIAAVRHSEAHRDRMDAHLRAALPGWSLYPLVCALTALRGIDVIAAAGLAAAIGDPSRFASAPDFMGYLGLVPSEHSSGLRRRLGAITKAGDVHARTLLIEAAWSYRLPARISRTKLARLEGVPDAVQALAWKAQTRLCARYRTLIARGKSKQVVVTAIARELAGFVWAIAQAVRLGVCPGSPAPRAAQTGTMEAAVPGAGGGQTRTGCNRVPGRTRKQPGAD